MPKKVKTSSKTEAKTPSSSASRSRPIGASSVKKEKSFFSEGLRGISVLLIIFAIVGYGIVYFLSNKPEIMAVCKQTREFVSTHESNLKTLLTTTFDEASKCPDNTPDCLAKNVQQLAVLFPDNGDLPNYSSTYFIRAEDEDHISKLFLSGRYQKDQADLPKEKQVMNVLTGKKKEICASGVKTDVNFTTMTYLKDFIVEAEIIEPVTENGKVIGAIVRLYGD